MNLQMTGPQRPKLSLNFATRIRPPREAIERRSTALSGKELRRVIADMIG
jgi:hypothetical protein